MATYNKRGYKAPKPKESSDSEFDQYSKVNAADSTTAEVFDSLDKGASHVEGWAEKNQKYIYGVVGAIALITVGYLGYGKLVLEPKEEDAANEIFQAQSYFTEATNSPINSDSLYNLALNGGEGKLGLLGVIESYSGTKTANLAEYYAGMSYLNTGDFKNAISHLEKFRSEDMILSSLALGGIGDAFSELGQTSDALEYYKKAASNTQNDFTSPRFLKKAGLAALELGKKDEALKMFNEIKNNYQDATEATSVDALIGLAQ